MLRSSENRTILGVPRLLTPNSSVEPQSLHFISEYKSRIMLNEDIVGLKSLETAIPRYPLFQVDNVCHALLICSQGLHPRDLKAKAN